MHPFSDFLGNLPFYLTLQAGRYYLIAGGAFLLILAFKNWSQQHRFQQGELRREDLRREIFYSTTTVLLYGVILAFLFSPPILSQTKLYLGWQDRSLWWFPISLLGIFLIHDTYFYWMHKTLHHPLLYRRFHLAHHRSTNPTALASQAFHPIEAFFQFSWVIPVVFILPMHVSVLLAFSLISFLFNIYGHAHVRLNPKTWEAHNTWFNFPIYHNLHHRYADGNYGLYLRFWDRWMKTQRDH